MIRRKTVQIAVPGEDPIPVEVRTPTIGESAAFQSAVNSDEGQARILAQILVRCSFDPETGERLFTEADIDTILQCPTDGWVTPLVEEITGLLGTAEKAAKN